MSDNFLSYSKALKRGDAIGIISPSSAVKDFSMLERGKKIVEEAGFKVVLHPQNNLSWGQLAGSDEARAKAIMDMFADPGIDAIMCARGGNGAIRLLDKLDYGLIAQNPKPFIGFSDITVLLHAIRNRCNMITYHGPVVSWNLGNNYSPQTLVDFIKVVTQAGDKTEMEFPAAEVMQFGTAKGRLIGGNVTLLQNLVGTPYGWSGNGAILFIEDVDEILYRFDRTLRHFHHAGLFKGVKAVLVGEMINVPDTETSFMRPDERPYGPTLKQILHDIFPDVPLAINFPCGHGNYLTTLPVGAEAQVVMDNHGVKLTLMAQT